MSLFDSLFICTLLCTSFVPVLSLDNGLGSLPGLGWNSDYCTNCSGPQGMPWWGGSLPIGAGLRGFGGQHFVKHIADHMHNVKYNTSSRPQTLQELGFRYVNMDASWDSVNRSASGDLVPDPKLWPSGLDHTVDYVHSLGLGFGLYGDHGSLDCAKHPGARGHEKQDAEFFARHHVDWYKEDACYSSGGQTVALADYSKMRDALNASGYPVWFALCGWAPWYAAHGKTLANSARIGPDTGTGWTSVMKNIENALPVQKYEGSTAHGGYWNDGSLMLTPGMGCRTEANCMSDERFRSMYALWTIMSFNMLLVGDFAKLNAFVMGTWTNDWAVAINQDPLALGATRIDGVTPNMTLVEQNTLTRMYAPMTVSECGGEPADQKWVNNTPAPGFMSNAATKMCLNVIGCGTEIGYDGCTVSGKTCGPGKFSNERWELTGAGQLRSALTSRLCATVNAERTVTLSKCTLPVPPTQRWHYDTSTLQLTTGDGLCVTAERPSPSPSPAAKTTTMVLGKPLVGHKPGQVTGHNLTAPRSFAILFLNNKPNATTITCNQSCLHRLGMTPPGVGATRTPPGDTRTPPGVGATRTPPGDKWTPPGAARYVVQDVWSRTELMTVANGESIVATNVPGNGGSVYVRVDPVQG